MRSSATSPLAVWVTVDSRRSYRDCTSDRAQDNPEHGGSTTLLDGSAASHLSPAHNGKLIQISINQVGSHSVGRPTLGTQDLLHQDVQEKFDLAKEQQKTNQPQFFLYFFFFLKTLSLILPSSQRTDRQKQLVYCSHSLTTNMRPKGKNTVILSSINDLTTTGL